MISSCSNLSKAFIHFAYETATSGALQKRKQTQIYSRENFMDTVPISIMCLQFSQGF